MRALLAGGTCAALLSACVTAPAPDPDDGLGGVRYPDPAVENPGVIVIAQPQLTPPPAPPVTAPPPAPSEPPPDVTVEQPDLFANLPFWEQADLAPALAAFRRGCEAILQADSAAMLNPKLSQYGTYGDWQPGCLDAQLATDARAFFESRFAPLSLSTASEREGLLTGYYEPEVDVRITPDATYSEPILAKPATKAVQQRVRAELGPRSARVIAYGKPIDVFFLQIQGSGRLRYSDGRTLRAAYAGNNGHPYRSIGRVLIERGELSRDKSSKRDIERWMAEAGPKPARALMNENPRYIFFTEQRIEPGEGPRGAMRVPLTPMASIAVDPRAHPYGTLVWMNTKLPTRARDYRGVDTGLLVVAQDTGSAIRGSLRGDLFFGSGAEPGARAGVMKHPVRWTVLVPRHLAPDAVRVAEVDGAP